MKEHQQERSFGNGEVESSILSRSTSSHNDLAQNFGSASGFSRTRVPELNLPTGSFAPVLPFIAGRS